MTSKIAFQKATGAVCVFKQQAYLAPSPAQFVFLNNKRIRHLSKSDNLTVLKEKERFEIESQHTLSRTHCRSVPENALRRACLFIFASHYTEQLLHAGY